MTACQHGRAAKLLRLLLPHCLWLPLQACATAFDAHRFAAWLPPGALSWRIPFLWPREPQDQYPADSLPLAVWLCMVLGGVFGGLLVALQGIVLVYLDVGTFSMWVAPIFLVLSTAWQGLTSPLPSRVFAGIGLQVVGSIVDFAIEQRAKGAGH